MFQNLNYNCSSDMESEDKNIDELETEERESALEIDDEEDEEDDDDDDEESSDDEDDEGEDYADGREDATV